MKDLQVIDKVIEHAKLGIVSLDDSGHCLYRGPNGTKCFIGALIPDEAYEERFESNAVSDMPDVLEAAGLSPEQATLADDLQYIHDRTDPSRWIEKLTALRRKYNRSQ